MQPLLKSGEVKKARRMRPARYRQIKKRQQIRKAAMVWKGDPIEAAEEIMEKLRESRLDMWTRKRFSVVKEGN